MRLNEAIWGTEHGNFWYGVIGTQGTAFQQYINVGNSFFAASFDRLTQSGVEYSNGQLSRMAQLHPDQYNKLIDPSICYAAIPANSPLAAVSYLNRTSSIAGRVECYRGDVPLFLSIAFNDHDDNATSSMGCTGGGNGFLPNRWSQWDQAAIADWDQSTEYPTGGRYIIPITKYNYNDVVLLIRVIVGNNLSDPLSRTTVDLAAWDKQAYPYLYCVFGVPYIGNTNRQDIGNYLSIAYPGFGTTTTRYNYLRCSRNIEITAPPNYHGNDVNDYDQSSPLINYNSNRWTNQRQNYPGTYGFSIGSGNASITPNASLDTFANTGSIDGQSGIYVIYGDDTVIESYPFLSTSQTVTKLRDDVDPRKLMAWYGLQFVDHIDKINAQVGSEDLCIPVITDDGYTTDEYRIGDEAAELPNATWGEDFREKNGYDGKPSEQFDMETELRPNNNAASSPFTYQYILTSQQIRNLKDFLYTTVANNTDETELFQKFLTNNPIDCIASLVTFPFNVANYALTVADEPVIMGNVDSGIRAPGIYTGMIIVVDAGSVEYRDKYKDFRSYEPYCDAEIHIPYHGSVHISPSEYVGHQIGVKYLIDISSGASIALVFRDGLAVDSIAGQVGATLRLTGIQTASYHNDIYSASSGYKQAKASQITQAAGAVLGAAQAIQKGNVGGILSSLVGGIGGAVQADIQTENAEYNLNHVQVPYKSIGSNTTFTSMGNEQYCRLVIKRPIMEADYKPEIYGHTTGFACCITAKLGSVSGYTAVAAADLSGLQISAAEKQQLLRLLQSGIFM